MEYGSERKFQVNPCQNANYGSKLLFGWTIPLFKRTYGKILDAGDVCRPLTEDQSRALGDRINKYRIQQIFTQKKCHSLDLVISICRKWCEECKTNQNPSLLRAIAKTFWPQYLWIGFLTLLFDVVAPLSLPFLLRHFLEYFRYECDLCLLFERFLFMQNA